MEAVYLQLFGHCNGVSVRNAGCGFAVDVKLRLCHVGPSYEAAAIGLTVTNFPNQSNYTGHVSRAHRIVYSSGGYRCALVLAGI